MNNAQKPRKSPLRGVSGVLATVLIIAGISACGTAPRVYPAAQIKIEYLNTYNGSRWAGFWSPQTRTISLVYYAPRFTLAHEVAHAVDSIGDLETVLSMLPPGDAFPPEQYAELLACVELARVLRCDSALWQAIHLRNGDVAIQHGYIFRTLERLPFSAQASKNAPVRIALMPNRWPPQ
jgi:hypothetical protein